MRFFIPGIFDLEEAENTYVEIAKRLGNLFGELQPIRYYSSWLARKGSSLIDTVGKTDSYENSLVMAIYRVKSGKLFLICTQARGFHEGYPKMHDGDGEIFEGDA